MHAIFYKILITMLFKVSLKRLLQQMPHDEKPPLELAYPVYNSYSGKLLVERLKAEFGYLNIKGTIEFLEPVPSQFDETLFPDSVGVLSAVVQDWKHDIAWLVRRIQSIIAEEALPLSSKEFTEIEEKVREQAEKYVGVALVSWLYNSVTSIRRSLDAIWNIDQFIHLWRGFNELYSSIYEKETGKKADKPPFSKQEEMYDFLIEKFLNNADCEKLVNAFIEKYDFSWIRELKFFAMMSTKGGQAELEKKGVLKIDDSTKEALITPELKSWKNSLNIRHGFDFWENHDAKNYVKALEELLDFVYETGRNRIFHGKEPAMYGDDFWLMNASINLLFNLNIKIVQIILSS